MCSGLVLLGSRAQQKSQVAEQILESAQTKVKQHWMKVPILAVPTIFCYPTSNAWCLQIAVVQGEAKRHPLVWKKIEGEKESPISIG